MPHDPLERPSSPPEDSIEQLSCQPQLQLRQRMDEGFAAQRERHDALAVQHQTLATRLERLEPAFRWQIGLLMSVLVAVLGVIARQM
ncbi:hypothetical protein [Pseudoduganella sp. RAF53_2]|uniref:hypothetical protein n=1 Tax=unclassified Pseudoduganella TaxID=2637179 RepID=UPI003F99DF03